MSIEGIGRIRNGSGGTVSFVNNLDKVVDGRESGCHDLDAPDHSMLVWVRLLLSVHANGRQWMSLSDRQTARQLTACFVVQDFFSNCKGS